MRILWLLIVASMSLAALFAQTPATDPALTADRRIFAEVKEHNQLMSNLSYLCDVIGPRLTGSANFDKAAHWTAQVMRDYGLENVHLEPWTIPHSWTRGTAEAQIVSPTTHRVSLASYGWAAGTPGAVRGPVVYVNAKTADDLAAYRGKLKGAVVIMFPPTDWEAPPNPLLSPYGDDVLPLNRAKPPLNFAQFNRLYRMLAAEGAAAILMQSDKQNGLLSAWPVGYLGEGGHYGTPDAYHIGATPAAYIAWEDYNLIWRLLQRGPVEMELNIQNSYSQGPVEVYNVSGEIKGVQRPDELVLLAAHLDSWDLGTGAADDGTGSMAVLEAARALSAAHLKPKRTIRVVLFGGEEQGLIGSGVYVAAHQAELPKISAVLVHDLGTGKVLSIGLERNFAAREAMDGAIVPLHDLGLSELSLRSNPDADDHASFDAAGVPAFWAIQDPLDYNLIHHSASDTLDHIREDGLVQGAQVLAAWSYNVSELPGLLPRKGR